LVVVVVSLAITLIPIVVDLSPIKQQRNTDLKNRQQKRKRKRSTTRKQLKLSHHTTKEHQIKHGSVMRLHPQGGGEKSLLKTEKKIQELQENLSLSLSDNSQC